MEDLRELKKERRELDKELRKILNSISTYDFESCKWKVLTKIHILFDNYAGRKVYDLLGTCGEELFVDLESRLKDLIHSNEVDYEATGFWWSINDLKCSIKWVR